MRRTTGAVVLLLMAAAGPLQASEPGPAPLTLTEALQRAETGSPELAAARAHADAQRARAAAAGRATWPRLTLSADSFRTDNAARVFASRLNRAEFRQEDFAIGRLNDPDGVAHMSSAALLEVPVDAFGKGRARVRGEGAVGRALEARSAEVAQEVRLRVVEAYRGAGLAQAAQRATERALEAARAREGDVAARVEQGAALFADLLRARARRRQREADQAARTADVRVALAELARAMGERGPDDQLLEAAAAPPPLEGSLAEWQARAAGRRPALPAARERVVAAEWAWRSEGRASRPDMALYGQVLDDRGSLGGGRQSYAVGAGLRWTPFDPARSRRVAAADAERRAARIEASSAADQVRLEVETAFHRAVSARARYSAAAGGSEEGREALRVVRERRQAGLATLTDELETEAASLAVELEELRAAADAAVADAALRRAAGVL